jgi:hypothetical protein
MRWTAAWLLLAACSTPETVGTLHVLQLAPGSAWDLERSLEDIAANELVPHNEVIAERFARGELVANALRADGMGFYLYDADAIDPDALLADDPAIQTDLLTPVLQTDWSLEVEDLGAAVPDGQSVFLVETTVAGVPSGTVLAAGPWDEGGALSVVLAGSASAARAAVDFAEGDAVGEPVAWGNPDPFPRFFHRRSLTQTQEVR